MPTSDTTPSTALAWSTLLQAVRRDIGAFTRRARRVLIRRAREIILNVALAPTRNSFWGTAKMFVVLSLVATVVSMTAMLLVLRDLHLMAASPQEAIKASFWRQLTVSLLATSVL